MSKKNPQYRVGKDHVMNKELLERTGMRPLSKEQKNSRLRMTGHILQQNRRNHTNVALS